MTHSLESLRDLLSSDNYIQWHFINDPRWLHEPHEGNQGWCGHVQLNFFSTLMRRFKVIARDCRRLTFYTCNDDSHCVTWYKGFLIDTYFNLLVYEGQYIQLTEYPCVFIPPKSFDRYYRVHLTNWTFQKIYFTQSKSISKEYFPPLLQ